MNVNLFKWRLLCIFRRVDIGLGWLCNLGDLERINKSVQNNRRCINIDNNNGSERTNAEVCSLNKSQHSQQTENNTRPLTQALRLPRLNMLVTNSSRSMMAWWCSSGFYSFPYHSIFIVSRLHANANSSAICYAHKLFLFGMAMKEKLIAGWRRRPGRGRDEKEKKKNKNQYSRNAVEKSGTSRGGRKTWGRRINKPNTFSVLFRTHLSIPNLA